MGNWYFTIIRLALVPTMVFFFFAKNLLAQPELLWAQKVNGFTNIRSHVVDTAGNVYCSGYFFGTVDFDNSTSSSFLMKEEDGPGFVMKLDASGKFVWAVQFQVQHPIKLALDNEGYIYACSNSHKTFLLDLDPGPGEVWHLNNTPGFPDVFVVKLDTDGKYVWGKAMGGTYLDNGEDVIADPVYGGVYVWGIFNKGGDFDPGPGTFILQPVVPDQSSTFILRLDKDGQFVWAYASYSHSEIIETNSKAGVFFTANYINEPVLYSPIDTIDLGINSPCGHVINFSPEGTLNWTKPVCIPTGLTAVTSRVAETTFDNSDNMYLTGYYTGEIDFDTDTGVYIAPYVLTYTQIYYIKLGPAGEFIWATTYLNSGLPLSMGAHALKTNHDGSLFVSGRFSGTVDFDAGLAEHNLTAIGDLDIFILKLFPDGQFDWVFKIGSSRYEENYSLNILNNHELIISGVIGGYTDFNPGPGVFALTGDTYGSGFVAKYKVPNTAVFQPDPTETFTVYPNPATDWIQLPADVEGKTFTVYNEMGALSKTGTLSGLDGKIGIGNLPEGYYTVCIDGAKKRHVGKFLKRRG